MQSLNKPSNKYIFLTRTLFWFFVLISTNILVGWSAYHWKDAIVKRSLDNLLTKATTVDRENQELQDIVADARQKNSDFLVMSKKTLEGDSDIRTTVQAPVAIGGSFSIRTPLSWGIVGVSSVKFAPEGSTEKIVGGFLLTPEYTENIEIPYDPTLMIWVARAEYKDDSGVRAVAGDLITATSQFAYFGQVRINDRRECKNNDKICRETMQRVATEASRVFSTFVPLENVSGQ